MSTQPLALTAAKARRIWLHAQRRRACAVCDGAAATRAAVEHLGYVQIDTINVIERSHHHILSPAFRNTNAIICARRRPATKTVFEYWTHALSYLPTRDLRSTSAA